MLRDVEQRCTALYYHRGGVRTEADLIQLADDLVLPPPENPKQYFRRFEEAQLGPAKQHVPMDFSFSPMRSRTFDAPPIGSTSNAGDRKSIPADATARGSVVAGGGRRRRSSLVSFERSYARIIRQAPTMNPTLNMILPLDLVLEAILTSARKVLGFSSPSEVQRRQEMAQEEDATTSMWLALGGSPDLEGTVSRRDIDQLVARLAGISDAPCPALDAEEDEHPLPQSSSDIFQRATMAFCEMEPEEVCSDVPNGSMDSPHDERISFQEFQGIISMEDDVLKVVASISSGKMSEADALERFRSQEERSEDCVNAARFALKSFLSLKRLVARARQRHAHKRLESTASKTVQESKKRIHALASLRMKLQASSKKKPSVNAPDSPKNTPPPEDGTVARKDSDLTGSRRSSESNELERSLRTGGAGITTLTTETRRILPLIAVPNSFDDAFESHEARRRRKAAKEHAKQRAVLRAQHQHGLDVVRFNIDHTTECGKKRRETQRKQPALGGSMPGRSLSSPSPSPSPNRTRSTTVQRSTGGASSSCPDTEMPGHPRLTRRPSYLPPLARSITTQTD